MKKNIKIIILSILMIFILSVSVFAETLVLESEGLLKYCQMTNEQLKSLSEAELENIQERLVQILNYRTDASSEDKQLAGETNNRISTILQQKRNSVSDILNMSDTALNGTSLSKLRQYVERLESYKTSLQSQPRTSQEESTRINNELQNINSKIEKINIIIAGKIYYLSENELKNTTKSTLKYYQEILEEYGKNLNISQEEYIKSKEKVKTVVNEKNGVTPQYGDFDYKDYNPSAPTNYSKATEIAGNILAIVRNIGVVIAFISLTLIGVKYMLGSADEKAGYKKSMIPFVVGLVLFVAVTTFISVIYNAVSGIL